MLEAQKFGRSSSSTNKLKKPQDISRKGAKAER
jgi:hypothetical protein